MSEQIHITPISGTVSDDTFCEIADFIEGHWPAQFVVSSGANQTGETVRIERHHGMDLPLYWIRHGSLGEEIADGPYRLIQLPRKRKRS